MERVPCKRRKNSQQLLDTTAGWLFIAPAVLGFLIFTIGPMLTSFYYSFTEFDIVSQPQWIGWENYRFLLSGEDPHYYKALSATTKYVILGTPAYVAVSLLIAMLLNSGCKGKGFFRTLFFLPAMVPVIASSLIWIWMTDPSLGVINNLLKQVGIYTNIRWFYSESTSVMSMVLLWIWSCGSTMIVFLAGLQGIPREQYEAMDVDGGNWLHKFLRITLPMLTPTTLFCVMVSFINAVQCFVPPYSITNGGPNNSTLFYIFFMYREAFSYGKMGKASAIAWLLFIPLLIITRLFNRTTKYWVYYEGGEE